MYDIIEYGLSGLISVESPEITALLGLKTNPVGKIDEIVLKHELQIILIGLIARF